MGFEMLQKHGRQNANVSDKISMIIQYIKGVRHVMNIIRHASMGCKMIEIEILNRIKITGQIIQFRYLIPH